MGEPSEQNPLDESKHEEEPPHEHQQQQQQQQQSESELFWGALQGEPNSDLPTHVKNVLRLCRLDRPPTFRCIRDETLDDAEMFARKHMKYQLMGVEANLSDYYGPYQRAPHKFRFAVGDRILLKQMASRARSKPDDFWRRAPPPPGPAREAAPSELEPSDEEDRPQAADEPPNLEQERRKLADMVRAMLRKEEYADGEEPSRLAARVKVRVEMRPMQEADGSAARDVVTGYIKCVFCATRLMIRKQSFGARKPRWVISNYRRHIRFHVDGKPRKTLARGLGEQANEAEEQEEHEAEEQEVDEAYS